jgi:alpha-glucosidase (family GH31 glycosyl hydrolase)
MTNRICLQGNKPGSNCQFYSNSRTLAHFARCAKTYKAWEFYRVELVREAAETGLPVARHLFLHYPEDKRAQALTCEQFLVGTEILVVPVLDKGQSGGGRKARGRTTVHGRFEVEVEAKVGCPAVFVRAGSAVEERFVSNLRDFKLL